MPITVFLADDNLIVREGVKALLELEEDFEVVGQGADYDELVAGRVLDSSRRTVVKLIEQLWDAGAGGVVLGCTELELLVHQADSELPVFPGTQLHVAAALDRALA